MEPRLYKQISLGQYDKKSQQKYIEDLSYIHYRMKDKNSKTFDGRAIYQQDIFCVGLQLEILKNIDSM